MTLSNKKPEMQLEELRKKEAEDLTKILSIKYRIPYLNLITTPINLEALKILPKNKAEKGQLAVFQKTGKILKIALRNPNLNASKIVLKDLQNKGFKLNLFLVSEKSLQKALDAYQNIPKTIKTSPGIIDISSEKIRHFSKIINNLENIKEELSKISSLKERRKTTEILEIIIAGALVIEASDIHIEPQEKKIDIRFRLDGVLQNIISVSKPLYQLLLSRIKLISGLKLNIREKAQNGRFSIHTDLGEVEVRSSSLPGPYGESIVLRLLHPKTISMKLEDLGMHPETLKIILKEIKKPNGMILTTGPTGSGKTTTLYAFLKKIYSSETKIITIEDPIEYHLPGITQTQVNRSQKYTFANSLKSILRQDPDIIMVGEIRDGETAEAAVHAALTGHLVFSTLHTKNAAGTILRLIDLSINPNLIAPAINLAIAQRLVRRLCPKSKIKDKPTPEEAEIIKKTIQTLPKNIKNKNLKPLNVWRAKPCPLCNNTGYKGRIGVFEALLMNKDMELAILKNPSEANIQKIAARQGILNIQQDGILKIIKGITSFEEVERVVGLRSRA
jgi:type IV pilus assembly protein PilB